MSGVIGGRDVGVAPEVDMFSVRILKSDISGSWGMFADGIEQILRCEFIYCTYVLVNIPGPL